MVFRSLLPCNANKALGSEIATPILGPYLRPFLAHFIEKISSIIKLILIPLELSKHVQM